MAEQNVSFAESGAGRSPSSPLPDHEGNDDECDGATVRERHRTSSGARPVSSPPLEATHAMSLDTPTSGNARVDDGEQVPSPPFSSTQQSTTDERSNSNHVTGTSSAFTRRSILTRGLPDNEDGCLQPKPPVRSESAAPSLVSDTKISSIATQENSHAAEILPHKKNIKLEKPTRPGAVAVIPFAPAKETALQATRGENNDSQEEEKTEESATHESAEDQYNEEALDSNTRDSIDKHHRDFELIEHIAGPQLSSSSNDEVEDEQGNVTNIPPVGPDAPMEEPLCTAELVPNENDVEARIKRGIIDGAAHADVVKPPSIFSRWRFILTMLLLMGVIVAVVVVVLVVVVNNGNAPANDPPQNNIQSNESGVNLTELILPISGDTIYENGTAQNLAFKWLSEWDLNSVSTVAKLVDLYVLSVLHFATGGPLWRVDACRWNDGNKGAFCNNANTVDEIYLGRNRLKGTIPDELGALTSLRVIGMEWNELTGAIPPSFGNLTMLERLDLSDNSLTGTIPAAIAALPSLKSFYARFNSLTGGIPSFASQQLLELYLIGNRLSGSLEDFFNSTGLAKLKYIDFRSDELTGSMPGSIGNFPQLERIQLFNNILTGTIPTEIGLLTNLEWLSLGDNDWSGTVPIELGNCTRLEVLYLRRCGLGGSFPSSVAHLSSLDHIYVQGTNFTNDYNETFCTREDPIWLEASCLEDAVSCPCCARCCNAAGEYESCVWCDDDYGDPELCFGN